MNSVLEAWAALQRACSLEPLATPTPPRCGMLVPGAAEAVEVEMEVVLLHG